MDFSQAQLDALAAIADGGSFEAAARALRITPSAVSQRVRALEAAAGQVLVSRGTPCRPTAHGERLVRLGRQARLLYDEARQELGTLRAVEMPVAVNADSLATWFRDVLAEAGSWPATSVLLHVEDQAHSQERLRGGEVLAAVTSEAGAVQGCAAEALGALRYVPAATPELTRKWRDGQETDWAAMPMLVFNEKDDLQDRQLRRLGLSGRPPVVHRVPSASDFFAGVRLGLGWGMLPEVQASPDLEGGRLERLAGDVIDVPLYWQRWRLESPRLARLTDAVRRAARRHLHQPPAPR